MTACRRHIATRLDRLELFGLDFEARWYPLSLAYVSLRTEQAGSGGRTVEEQLAGNERTMLVGRAGSGKTTVLQWVAVAAARQDLTGTLAYLNSYFPFFIKLRDYVGRDLPAPEEFLASAAPLLAGEAPAGWVRSQLDSGHALILVDGVDELPGSERNQVAEWLRDLTERFPGAAYVVSARPAAVPDDWLSDIGFARSSLEAMPPALVQEFVRHWHEASRQQLTDDEERRRLGDYERSLLAEVTKDRYLRDLADTPLLAGLLCALNRYLRGSLPRRRAEIYERALAMFDQRDRARGIDPSGLQLDLTAKSQVLADLALWMIRNGESEASISGAIGQIGRSLLGLSGTSGIRPEAACTFLLERSGLLREPAAGRLDFVHRTFQEYLAARAAIDNDAIGELIGNADNDQWSEVVVLAAGQANHVQASHLLRGLLRRTWRGHQRYARRVLAVACLQETRSLESALRADVESVIPGLLPPRTMPQAERLTAAGEALIAPLAAHWTRDPSKAPQAIRAASLIGGPAAMDLIYDIAKNTETTEYSEQAAELSRAWQYFETEEYAKHVLLAAKIRALEVSEPRQMPSLTHLQQIHHLQIRIRVDGTCGLGVLADLEQLESLVLWRYQLGDLTPIPALSRLKGLEVLATGGSLSLPAGGSLSLFGIERQDKLESLQLFGWNKVTSLHELNALPSLHILHIYTAQLDFSGFKAAGRTVNIFLYVSGTVDLAPLSGQTGITIYHDRETRIDNADVLGADSQVRLNEGLLRRLLPFA